MRKQSIEMDGRIKSHHFSWKEYVLTYLVILILSAGQGLIYAEYMNFSNMPPEYIFGMLGYWAIVTAVFCLITVSQKVRFFDKPMRKLSDGAKQVASGDFSVYLEPAHSTNKYDYIDVMFEDFNKMVEELGSIETLKNDFVANVSHEIKTPLSIIRNYAQVLKKQNLSREEQDEYIDTIVGAADNLTALVTNILKLSRLENQEIIPLAEAYDLCGQLFEIAVALEKSLGDKQIDLSVEIEERLTIHYDAGMLELVWHNLLSNAVKFTAPGGKIILKQTSDAEWITVSVSDTGLGMDSDTIKHIYDKFYQGETSHSGAGNGLGLALAKRVLELMGGYITIQSKLGEGSTFTVKLQTN